MQTLFLPLEGIAATLGLPVTEVRAWCAEFGLDVRIIIPDVIAIVALRFSLSLYV